MNKRSSNHGFTLVELLVAVGIAAVLAALMLSVVTSTLGLWTRAQSAFDRDAQAKLVLDLIERDLQAALFRADGKTWLAADIINAPAALVNHGWLTHERMKPATAVSQRYVPPPIDDRPPAITEARFGLSGVWLRLITANVETKDGDNPGSVPIAVAYQICRRPVSGDVSGSNRAPVRYALFRSAVGSEEIFVTGTNVLASGYGSSSTNPKPTRKPPTLTNPANADLIATHVVDFGLWLYRRDAAGELIRIFPATAGDGAHTANAGTEMPEVADVALRVLTERGARLIAAIERSDNGLVRPSESATDEAWWWAIVETHSRVYARRIEVKGGAR